MEWWRNKQIRPALYLLGVLVLLALTSDLLVNSRPLYCKIEGKDYYPGLALLWKDPTLPLQDPVLDSINRHFLWRQFDYDKAVFAPVPFAAGELPMSPDTTVRSARPGSFHPKPAGRFRHWLGTDTNGYDVAAGLIHGARIAVLTGAIAMGLAFFIGLLLGSIAGYWGDDRLRIRRGAGWFFLAGLPLAWFYAGAVPLYRAPATGYWSLAILSFTVVLSACIAIGSLVSRFIPYFAKKVPVPADLVIMRLAEVFTSIPGLLAIIAFAAMLQEQTQTLWAMVALIGAFSWPGVALFIRAELLRVRSMDYITAARGMGLSEWRILFRHALPNALRPAYTILAFGVGSAILLEASLSFLGYGDYNLQGASWGSLLQNARSSPQLWWISLPPGLAICLTLLALHSIGEILSERR
ncbi:MAG: ABC transporter permease [Bacteroidetes bacterium]|nr:MAG: ABC transporter permease [Bacteroidota bacterium]